jgi:hypothetical protein
MDYAAVNASLLTPIGTDDVMIKRGSVMERSNVDALQTYILTGIQATVGDISGLDTATLSDPILVSVCDGTTGKKTTVGTFTTYVHDALAVYIEGLASGSPVVDSDEFLIARSTLGKSITATVLSTYMIDEWWDQSVGTEALFGDQLVVDRLGTKAKITVKMISDFAVAQVSAAFDNNWGTIDTGDYTATPASTSQINMSDTTGFAIGVPVRYTYGGTTYYGIVATVTTDTLITVQGVALDTGQDLTALERGGQAQVVTEHFKIPGAYLAPWHTVDGEATKDVLADIAREYFEWRRGPAHLVEMGVTQGTADTTSQPYFNVKIASVSALTDNTNKGPQVSATPGTWQRAAHGFTDGLVDIANGNAIEFLCTPDATLTGDAADVSIELTFVLE